VLDVAAACDKLIHRTCRVVVCLVLLRVVRPGPPVADATLNPGASVAQFQASLRCWVRRIELGPEQGVSVHRSDALCAPMPCDDTATTHLCLLAQPCGYIMSAVSRMHLGCTGGGQCTCRGQHL
jgi:hypothetical protein